MQKIIQGDCLEVLKGYPDNHFTSVITDPPYFIGFMGKAFDNFKDNPAKNVDLWKEVLRVSKPGATLLAFGGDRTHHHLMLALEQAGWQIKTCVYWIFGSGFPKSTRINLDADRHLLKGDYCQCDEDKHSNAHTFPLLQFFSRICNFQVFSVLEEDVRQNVLNDLKIFEGFLGDYLLKCDSYDELLHLFSRVSLTFLQQQECVQEHSRLILPLDELDNESLHNLSLALYNALPSMQDYFFPSFSQLSCELQKEYVSANSPFEYLSICMNKLAGSLDFSKLIHDDKLVYDKSHIPYLVFCLPLSILLMLNSKKYKTIIPQMGICLKCFKVNNYWEGYGTALKPAAEIIIMAMKPNDGTYAENAIKHGVAGINIEKSRIGTEVLKEQKAGQSQLGTFERTNMITPERQGRFPSNLILDEESSELLGDKARLFYCAKTSKAERNAGCETLPIKQTVGGGGMNNTPDNVCGKYGSIKAKGHNFHPTVKPLALMKYLINLIMPPKDGLILDPFAGSGTTILAAKELGYDAIGVEREAEYCEIAKARIG